MADIPLNHRYRTLQKAAPETQDRRFGRRWLFAAPEQCFCRRDSTRTAL